MNITEAEWNTSIAGLPNAHILQTWEWGQLKSQYGWQPLPQLWRDDDGQVRAAALVLRRVVPGGLSVLYVPRGPLVNWNDRTWSRRVIGDLQGLARKSGAIFIKIDPELILGYGVPGSETEAPNPAVDQALADFTMSGWRLSDEQIQFRNTVLLDLTGDEAGWLARMKQKARYNLRLAQKKGVQVRAGTTADLPMLYRMYAETSVRDGFVIRDEDYYLKLWELFIDREMAEPLIAAVDGEPVAGIFSFYFARQAWYLYGMSRQAHREKMPNYLLQWEAMRRAKARGCTQYDLWGAPDVFNERDSMWGVFRFKEGIGAVAVLTGAAALAFGLSLFKPFTPLQPTPSLTPPLVPTSPPADTQSPLPLASSTFTLAPSETPTLEPSQTLLPMDAATPAALNTATQAPTPQGSASGKIAYSSEQDGQTQIWIMNSDGSDSQQLTHLPDGACQPDWSPDGKRLVFTSPCKGKKDMYAGSSLFIINADGTGLTPLATLPGGDFDPAWSPDAKQIAFTTLRDYNVPHVYLYNLADNTIKRLSKPVNRERHPAWSPDGTQLAYQTTLMNQPQIWIMSSSGENARDFSSLKTAYDSWPTWAPDGSTIVFSQGNQPFLVGRQVGDRMAVQFPVSERIRPAEEARFSIDGWWLAFSLKQDGNTDIYVMTRNGANLTRLTTNPGADFHPAWKP